MNQNDTAEAPALEPALTEDAPVAMLVLKTGDTVDIPEHLQSTVAALFQGIQFRRQALALALQDAQRSATDTWTLLNDMLALPATVDGAYQYQPETPGVLHVVEQQKI